MPGIGAMGCRGIRVEPPEDIGPAVHEALDGRARTVVDVVTSFKPSLRDVASPLAAV